MKWLEIKIVTAQEASEAISEALISAGANGVAIEDPYDLIQAVKAPGSLDYADEEYLSSLGEDVVIKAYFGCHRKGGELVSLLKEKIRFVSDFLDIGKGSVELAEVDEEDWAENWKSFYKPFKLSEKIVIKPTWEPYEAREGEIVVEMDPGMAFGTGTHDTTRMCALLLEKYLSAGQDVIDVGCGSGILSVIAAKLGAGKIMAVDIDETAVRVAGTNCEINGVAGRIELVTGELKALRGRKAGVVVANIIAGVITGLAPLIPEYLAPGGLFITSGIIKERRAEVKRACADRGLELEAEMESGEWVAMVFKCRDFS